MNIIPNVLASRYASEDLRKIWSDEGKILLERDFWIAILKAQKKLGLKISEKAIRSYERVKRKIHLDRILKRERVLRHDEGAGQLFFRVFLEKRLNHQRHHRRQGRDKCGILLYQCCRQRGNRWRGI